MSKNNVIHFLQKHATENPGKTALKWGDNQSISYQDFVKKISVVAHGLKELGIQKGDRILIFAPFSMELYLSMFAVQQIGAIAVFLDSWARKDQLGICANIVSPKAMISFDQAFALAKGIPELIEIPLKIVIGKEKNEYDTTLEKLASTEKECPIEPVAPSDTALITFTTGSSGVPKGANRTHRFLAAQHYALKKVIPYLGDETDLPVFPIFALNNLASGITTTLPAINLANPSKKDGEILANQISSGKIQCCTLSPSLFIKVADHCHEKNLTLSSLKRIVTGGAPVSNDNVENFKMIAPDAEILVLYGSTEVEPIAHIEANEMLACHQKQEGANVGQISTDLDYKLIKITKDNVELSTKGWNEWEVSPSQPGELIVSGLHVCEGYYNNNEAFKRAKIRDQDGTIWHRTGDVGLVDEKGSLWLVGRVHNTIIREGQFLFPVQAEILLKKLSFVRQGAFLGITDPEFGEKTAAVISVKTTSEDASVLHRKISTLMEENQIPVDQIHIIDEIPMDPRHHSKVEYAKLREMIS